MYFNSNNNSSTNIDDEFKKSNSISIRDIFNKYKLFIVIGIILVIIIILIVIFMNNKSSNYLMLNGEENITLYQGADYVEPGFEAYNSKNEDLSSEVVINSTLDTNKIGEYEITYTVDGVIRTRKITVIAKPEDYAYLYLKTVNNSVNIYVKLGETYNEPGYQVFSSTGKDLTDQVEVTGSVDTSRKGSYKLIYSIVDSNGVTVSASRTVIVMDADVSLSLSPEEYTNGEVTINVGVIDNYFDYILLPDNRKVTTTTTTYKVSSNGKYTFKVYNKKGDVKESSIEVKNIDKNAPTGSCSGNYQNGKSTVIVSARDDKGINKYEINGKSYTNSTITLTGEISNVTVKIYDKAGNSKSVSCNLTKGGSSSTSKPTSSSVDKTAPSISSISNDGVIVTIKAQKANSNISGYYFSYTNKRPSKDGGYLATSNESVDVVRLPGTTYVWVEDASGKISQAKTITITNDVLLLTEGSSYTILKTDLPTYLSKNGWSFEGLNNLLARSVRAAGIYSKEAAATSGIALQTVLAQKYKIKLPYWWGGKYWKIGADDDWGSYRETVNTASNTVYRYYGLDCSGFVNWTYINSGYDFEYKHPGLFRMGVSSGLSVSKNNGEAGDLLVVGYAAGGTHEKIIVGKTNEGFIVAEAQGLYNGMVLSIHKYDQDDDYKLVKGETMVEKLKKIDKSTYPSGF